MAEVLKDKFIHNQSQRDTVDITAQLENKAEVAIELSASFLAYVTESIAKDQSTHARTALLLNVFKYFTSTYLATKDFHSLTSTFDTDTRKTVLSAYFLTVAALKAREIDTSIPKQESALLAAALSKKASIFALFSGQGTNEDGPQPRPLRIQHQRPNRSDSRARSTLETPRRNRQREEHLPRYRRRNGKPRSSVDCAFSGDDLVQRHPEPEGPFLSMDERGRSFVRLAGRIRRIQRC